MTVLLVLSVGAAIGAMLGMLGGGGSILLVPSLAYLGGMEPRQAILASLILVAAISAAATLPIARAHQIHWPYVAVFVAVGVPSAVATGAVSARLPRPVLMLGLAMMMFFAATQMLARAASASRMLGAAL